MDILERLKAFRGFDYESVPAGKFQDKIRDFLVDTGFSVKKEVRVQDRGDGRTGRIDLVAEKGGFIIAIEVDRFSPRKKSIYKLLHYPASLRIVIQRSPFNVVIPTGS